MSTVEVVLLLLGAAVGVMVGAVVNLFTQWLTLRLTIRREREARLFDTRREVYAETLREVGRRLDLLYEPSHIPDFLDTESPKTHVLGSELALLGSGDVSRAFDRLATTLNEALEDHPEQYAMGYLGYGTSDAVRRDISDGRDALLTAMRADLRPGDRRRR